MKYSYLLYLGIAILAIILIKPESGLFATVDIEETFPCPEESLITAPCAKAFWVDTPYCFWNISTCDNYCGSDQDCIVPVPAANDCSLFFEPYNVTEIGYCDKSFCKWQVLAEQGPACSATDLFLQQYKWYILISIILIGVGFFAFEKDFGGKKRGFF